MNVICAIRGHDVSAEEVCNGGQCFSRCMRCGQEMIRSGEAWKPIPKGYRVVWSSKAPADDRTEEATAVAEATLDVPIPPVPEAPPASQPQVADPGPLKHVLVCDDDPLITDLLEHKLSGRGYRVTIATNGEEAVARIAEERPDAILLDAMMPMMDGYEVLRRVRQDETMAKVPVIMLTARKQEQDIVGALGIGADDFIVKPFIPEELLSRLARLMAA